MSISARAVDVVYGRPAAGVRVCLMRNISVVGHKLDDWLTVDEAETDSDGFIRKWTVEQFGRGPYQVVFDSDAYFAMLGLSTAYKEVSVVVRLADESDSCQIQVGLAPYAYSMFFGFRG